MRFALRRNSRLQRPFRRSLCEKCFFCGVRTAAKNNAISHLRLRARTLRGIYLAGSVTVIRRSSSEHFSMFTVYSLPSKAVSTFSLHSTTQMPPRAR